MPPAPVNNDGNGDENEENKKIVNNDKDKEKDKEKDKKEKEDEGFGSDSGKKDKKQLTVDVGDPKEGKGKERKNVLSDKDSDNISPSKKPPAPDIYANIPPSPHKDTILPPIDPPPSDERKLAPVPRDAYVFPPSPLKYRGPPTPVQKLRYVSLPEAQQHAKSEEVKPTPSHQPKPPPEVPKAAFEPARVDHTLPQTLPVQQLDLRDPSGSTPVRSPARSPARKTLPPISRSPLPGATLQPTPAKTDKKRSPSRSPARSDASPMRTKSKERKPGGKVAQSVPGTQKKQLSRRASQLDVSQDSSASTSVQGTPAALQGLKTKGPDEIGQKLLLLSKKGDWVGVDTIIKYAEKNGCNTNICAEQSGWTPLMFAVKDNRANIVEKLLNLGYNVNARATVSH